ncbi:MAG: L-seryl-tRNA(Sec) selenium transferase, partial [Deltaproteobacteria bacterium]|nr:L-seryl-tRNA(Sec) selenium transferase [Deltaproteobacteria bacterium]
MTDLYRNLPAVNAVLADPRVAALPRGVAVAVTRETLDRLRASIREDTLASVPDVAALVAEAGVALLGGATHPVINATGVVIHTNLGRAPWAAEAVRAAAAAAGYCSLEMDLAT